MKTTAARTAQAIRKDLKAAFPSVKFSVRSQTYSMGDNVNVSWTDGPTTHEVKKIIGKYEQGSFDPMTDMYEYDNDIEGLPQTKYLFVNRISSEQ